MAPKRSIAQPYHTVGVFYLERGRELPGSVLAQLWASAAMLGPARVTGNFWHEGKPPRGNRRFDLGSLSLLQPLLNSGDQPIFGGGQAYSKKVVTNPYTELDFYYAHGGSSRSAGYETWPQLVFSVSGAWFERVGTDTYLSLVREHLEAADRCESPYGLVDVSASEDCYGGAVYESFGVSNAPLRRWIEDVWWHFTCSKRRDQARGIYWGNYFGRAILDRLGGRERFLAGFRRQASFEDGRPAALVWEFPNGVFVSLCLDPLGCRPGLPVEGWAVQNAHWLLLELGSHGVLNPWSPNTAGPG